MPTHLRRPLWIVSVLFLAATLSLRADTTLRYKLTWKAGGLLPPDILAMAPGTMPHLPAEFMLRLKGGKGRTDGGMIPAEIVDLSQDQITLLDPAHHRFATASMKDYLAQLSSNLPASAMPPAMLNVLAAMKIAVESHKTGRTDSILGIQVEETAITLTVTLNVPDPSGGATPALQGPVFRVELQNWTALPSETLRVASLAQVETFGQLQTLLFNPLATEQKALANLPAPLRDNLTSALASLHSDKSAMLRMHAAFYTPMLASLLKFAQSSGSDMPAQAKPMLAGMDPSAPLGEVTLEAVELSDRPLDDSLFSTPDDYQAQPLPDLIKALALAPPKLSARPANAYPAPESRARLPILPAVAKLNPGQPLAADQLAWLQPYAGQSSQAAIRDPKFPALLQSITPAANYHMGVDMPLAAAVNSVLRGPAYPVAAFDGDRMLISARRSAQGRGNAFVWIDPQHGSAIGGLLLFFGSNRPSPELTLFSAQIAARVTRMAQLPPAFVADFRQWSVEKELPATPAVFFINHDGEQSVVMHAPLACRGAETSICEAADSDAAETDMQAAYYLVKQRFPAGATAAAVAAEQDQWLKDRSSSCAAPARGESPLACRTRLTRQRAQALSELDAHPPGA